MWAVGVEGVLEWALEWRVVLAMAGRAAWDMVGVCSGVMFALGGAEDDDLAEGYEPGSFKAGGLSIRGDSSC